LGEFGCERGTGIVCCVGCGQGKLAVLVSDALAGGDVDGETGGVVNLAFGVFAKSSTIGIDLCCGTASGGMCGGSCW